MSTPYPASNRRPGPATSRAAAAPLEGLLAAEDEVAGDAEQQGAADEPGDVPEQAELRHERRRSLESDAEPDPEIIRVTDRVKAGELGQAHLHPRRQRLLVHGRDQVRRQVRVLYAAPQGRLGVDA